jgi:ABC-type branched-subunit amino acid transport system ATPase component
MLCIEHLDCGYGAVRAVHDVSFDVPAASIFALLGPNGAGKTSTIMAIMGHVNVHSGRILLNATDITRRRAVERVNLGIALVPEGRQLFSDLTVDENLTVGGYARPFACSVTFRGCMSDAGSLPARFPAASSRCSPLAALSWLGRGSFWWTNCRSA